MGPGTTFHHEVCCLPSCCLPSCSLPSLALKGVAFTKEPAHFIFIAKHIVRLLNVIALDNTEIIRMLRQCH